MKNLLKSIFKPRDLDTDLDDQTKGALMYDDDNEPPTFVEIPEEEIKSVATLHSQLSQQQMRMGQITIEYEQKKKAILENMQQTRDKIEEEIETLRHQYAIPEDNDNYILNLPSKNNPKGSFIRNEAPGGSSTTKKEEE